MPGMSFSYIVKAEDGSLMKQETVSFHGPGRMIVEEAANDVAMITVYEKQTWTVWFGIAIEIKLYDWNFSIWKKLVWIDLLNRDERQSNLQGLGRNKLFSNKLFSHNLWLVSYK